MMFQIEYLINESFLKTNEHITNLINPKYIKWSFLIDRRFMQWFTHTHTHIYIYIYLWEIVNNTLILSQDMHTVIFVYLFILCK